MAITRTIFQDQVAGATTQTCGCSRGAATWIHGVSGRGVAAAVQTWPESGHALSPCEAHNANKNGSVNERQRLQLATGKTP